MSYKTSMPAPASRVPEERRGRRVGTFCLDCGSVYPLHRAVHRGKPVYGRDHVAAPCSHEGEPFEPGASWWQPAVDVLPALVPQAEDSAGA